jgi:asparagine synthase (glutamine-hydrolysing)
MSVVGHDEHEAPPPMSGICGWLGDAPLPLLTRMLDAIDYRGDSTDVFTAPGVALGYRWWRGRPCKSPSIWRSPHGHAVACAGTLALSATDPAEALASRLEDPAALATLDGAFAAASWDATRRTLTLLRDPFGVRSLYWCERDGVVYFASELKQLLATGQIPRTLDHSAIHKYLTFSFVPGDSVPIAGVRRLLPGNLLTLGDGAPRVRPYFVLEERVDPALTEQAAAVRHIRKLGKAAVHKRLVGEQEVGLYLSGGLDSSAVGVWLREAGAKVRALSLDFGEHSVEREQADEVARSLDFPLERVPVRGPELATILDDLVYKLDLPFGDAVTGPQYLLGQAARQLGLGAVFNGEGGDQLFGGWTTKPMIAATLYADLYGEDSPEEQYLHAYHRYYGHEAELYTPEFMAAVGGPGQRRAMLAPYLGDTRVTSFLNRVRLADIALKGSQNILPRAERLANAFALDLRVPLFDRALAEASFALPPELKLHGAAEKYVLKLAMQQSLPHDIVWRRKFGMSVPITEWVLGPLAEVVADRIGPASLARRGLFKSPYVERLRAGRGDPAEPRRRRIGEKLWALVMLESWLRVFVDGARS